MIATLILGIALRFLEGEQQKRVLWAHVGALMISQYMLAGKQGEFMAAEVAHQGGIGTFISIAVATLGAL